MEAGPNSLIPAEPDARVIRVFAWYVRRMFRKRFNGVRLALGSAEVLRELEGVESPVIVLLSHASWWDPLIGLLLQHELMAGRSGCAPMDSAQLKRFGFFRKLGVFGIDPNSPESMAEMVSYVGRRFEQDRRPTLWITGQGRFADPREAVVLRPGAAAVAAKSTGVRVVSVCVEYVFWQDQRPECLVRACGVDGPMVGNTAGWQRAMQRAMEANAAALASLAVARDASAFEVLLGAGAGSKEGRIHPVYDWWLRKRGVGGKIEGTRR